MGLIRVESELLGELRIALGVKKIHLEVEPEEASLGELQVVFVIKLVSLNKKLKFFTQEKKKGREALQNSISF